MLGNNQQPSQKSIPSCFPARGPALLLLLLLLLLSLLLLPAARPVCTVAAAGHACIPTKVAIKARVHH